MVARAYQHSYGQPIVVARLFNTYGPGMERFVLLDFLHKLQANPQQLEILGTGEQQRDFAYVTDVCRALLLLGTAGGVGEAYNVSSGESVTITALAQRLLVLLGLAGQTELTYTGQSWAGDAQRWEVAIDKLKALGFQPAVSLDAGLQRTMAWFEDNYGAIIP